MPSRPASAAGVMAIRLRANQVAALAIEVAIPVGFREPLGVPVPRVSGSGIPYATTTALACEVDASTALVGREYTARNRRNFVL
jgi:hypothetical protein